MKPALTEEERILTLEEKVAWLQFDVYALQSQMDLMADRKDEPNCSEIPNNCEHINEDGVTCAKYPACDDCPNNPLNKVKGSERLLKGKDEPQTGSEITRNSLRSDCTVGKNKLK